MNQDSPVQHQIYEDFRDQLMQLLQSVREGADRRQAAVTHPSHDRDRVASPATNLTVPTMTEGVANLQQMFRQQILTIPLEDIHPAHRIKVQSYQAEISKELRLVGLDCTFLTAARQAQTQGQRTQQVIDRLETLIRYCDGILHQLGQTVENPQERP
ncbi:heterocyst frequency control protein PatD [Alkalinema sp. FACHB-956]|uniref:heterocyst frequency control protein PatD n=1 Tax=Alkalinema sp. FACHB-956 TaxID=2692768 RepID=UPI0016893E49|nr:heterocyst frequency control protein PatD [Alkalinema sp. FACHB-956]MBD2328590.1 heterocyst frequency control protein PatD [Alkalinema sp. FACHB-956]